MIVYFNKEQLNIIFSYHNNQANINFYHHTYKIHTFLFCYKRINDY